MKRKSIVVDDDGREIKDPQAKIDAIKGNLKNPKLAHKKSEYERMIREMEAALNG